MSIYINHRRGHGSQSYSEETKTIPKNIICEKEGFFILVAFQVTNTELKEVS